MPAFFTKYLHHSLKSRGRHGLHSPFMYHLLDGVIYNSRPLPAYKKLNQAASKYPLYHCKPPARVYRLLYRLIAHFAPRTLVTGAGLDPELLACLHSAAPDALFYTDEDQATAPIDLMLRDAARPLPQLKAFHNLSVLLMANINASPAAIANWQTIKQQPKVTVTADLFWLGLVFFKTDQAQQHFKLRYL